MPCNPTILAFDTSAAYCAALLLRGDRVLASAHKDMTKGQAERLFPLLQEVLEQGAVDWPDLDAIGICTGPGNFTGVRIGVSAARGLALSLGIPAVGISMLEALAFGQSGITHSILDARRERFYTQKFTDGKSAQEPELLSATELDSLKTPLNCVTAATCNGPQNIIPRPTLAIARLAAARFQNETPRPAPLYLRPPNAALPTELPPTILP